MPLEIPQPLKEEHEELHAVLARATKAGGRTGQAALALALAHLMGPHFEKEDEFALPPLGLPVELARGEVTPEASAVLVMTDRLQSEMPEMLAEHAQIVAALEELKAAAGSEGHAELVRFAVKLKAHARMEEEVSYPAALVIGRYVRLLKRVAAGTDIRARLGAHR